MDSEKQVEKFLKDETERRGGICYKFVSPGRVSVPDRIVILSGIIAFVECKGEGGKVNPKQHRELQRLADLKMNVFVVTTKAEVTEVIRRMMEYVILQESTPIPEASNN